MSLPVSRPLSLHFSLSISHPISPTFELLLFYILAAVTPLSLNISPSVAFPISLWLLSFFFYFSLGRSGFPVYLHLSPRLSYPSFLYPTLSSSLFLRRSMSRSLSICPMFLASGKFPFISPLYFRFCTSISLAYIFGILSPLCLPPSLFSSVSHYFSLFFLFISPFYFSHLSLLLSFPLCIPPLPDMILSRPLRLNAEKLFPSILACDYNGSRPFGNPMLSRNQARIL
jgi:hypothetical protein